MRRWLIVDSAIWIIVNGSKPEWVWLISLMLFPLLASSSSDHFLYNQQTEDFLEDGKSWRKYLCLACLQYSSIDLDTPSICLVHHQPKLVDISLVISVGVGPRFCICIAISLSWKADLFLMRSFTCPSTVCRLLFCLEWHTSFFGLCF